MKKNEQSKKNILLNNSFSGNGAVTPIKCYENTLLSKNSILSENKKKSGVYRWVNKLNSNTYVGSGLDLSKRIGDYYKKSELNRNSRPIKDALLKHGHRNFTLEILEYCPKAKLLEREQFYLDLLVPEYNILKIAGSNFGYKHSEASLKLMSDASKSRNESEEVLKFKKEIMLGRKFSKDHL